MMKKSNPVNIECNSESEALQIMLLALIGAYTVNKCLVNGCKKIIKKIRQ